MMLKKCSRIIQMFCESNKPLIQPKKVWKGKHEKERITPPPVEQKKPILFNQKPIVSESKKSHNQFLKDFKQQSETEKQINDRIQSIEQQPNSTKKIAKLIHLYHKLGNQAKVQSLYADSTDSEVQSVYISTLNDFKQQKKILDQADCSKFDHGAFKSAYLNIFRSNRFPYEIAQDLEYLFKKMHQCDQKLNGFDLQQFNVLVDMNRYQRNPRLYQNVVQVFTLYFLADTKPFTMENIISLAVEEQIKNNTTEAELIFAHLRKSQIPADNYDKALARLVSHLCTQKNKFTAIVELIRGVKQSIIPQVDILIKDLEAQGKMIHDFDIEAHYLKEKNHISLKNAELVCLYASRQGKYAIIADIYLMLTKAQQLEISSYIYQKAIDVIVTLSNGENVSNQVMSIMLEARKAHVPLNKIDYDFNQIKSLIVEGNYEVAYNIFIQQIDDVIQRFQREKIKRLLLKYVQNNTISDENFENAFDHQDYAKKLEDIDQFTKALSPNQLKQLFVEESSDNILLQALIGQQDIFEFWEESKKIKIYEKIKNDIQEEIYNYERLLTDNDPDTVLERDIFLNYEYHVTLEKQRLLNERKKARIEYVLGKLSSEYLSARTDQQLLEEVYQTFTQEELEKDLLQNDTIEFPEIEQVKKMQDEFLKRYTALPQPQTISQKPQQIEIITDQEIEMQQEQSIDNEPEEENSLEALESLTLGPEEIAELPANEQTPENLAYQQALLDEFKEIYPEVEELYLLEQGLLNDKKKRADFIARNFELGVADDDMSEPEVSEDEEDVFDTTDEEELDDYTPSTLFISEGVDMADFIKLKYIYYQPYTQYNHYIRVPGSSVQQHVFDLVAWGIKNEEPLAIRLGEFYSNICGVKIPDHLARLIAPFYKYKVGIKDSPIREKWIKAFETTGTLDTSKIYNYVDNAFVSEEDIEFLQDLELQQQWKGLARSLLRTEYAPNRYVRYGVTSRDILHLQQ